MVLVERASLLLVVFCSACSAELTASATLRADAGGDPDGAGGPATLTIVAPAEGARYARDSVHGHVWVADVAIEVEAHGIARVDYRYADDTSSSTVDTPPFHATLPIRDEGELTVVAVGLDATGVELVRDEVGIVVEPPTDPSCHAMLDALGLEWDPAGETQGISDPIMLAPVIRGVSFRYASRDEPTPMLMDCSLAPRLNALVDLLEPHGIDEVIHLGIYNYRCIGGGDPDSGTCTPSQHAYAKAIDLHAFGAAGSDTAYSTETDWIIREDLEQVCPGMPATAADQLLHELACAMWSEGIFQIVLTPDYNDAHRNHFHVDLTEGSMFIGETVTGVDPWIPGLGD